jgi:hypothetical protein
MSDCPASVWSEISMMNIPAPQNLPTLHGERVRLRPPVERDKQDRLAAGRDPEFRQMVGGDPADCPPLTMPGSRAVVSATLPSAAALGH